MGTNNLNEFGSIIAYFSLLLLMVTLYVPLLTRNIAVLLFLSWHYYKIFYLNVLL